jgi:hypothetical protein
MELTVWTETVALLAHHEAFGKAFCTQETVNLLDDILDVAKSVGDDRPRERLVLGVLRHVACVVIRSFHFGKLAQLGPSGGLEYVCCESEVLPAPDIEC